MKINTSKYGEEYEYYKSIAGKYFLQKLGECNIYYKIHPTVSITESKLYIALVNVKVYKITILSLENHAFIDVDTDHELINTCKNRFDSFTEISKYDYDRVLERAKECIAWIDRI